MPPDAIRALRQNLGLDQATFAALLGYANNIYSRRVLISDYERGKRRPNPQALLLLRMIAAHGPTALTDTPIE
jgi:DNA-binding transcriptional regulator YiaG